MRKKPRLLGALLGAQVNVQEIYLGFKAEVLTEHQERQGRTFLKHQRNGLGLGGYEYYTAPLLQSSRKGK